MISLIRKTIFKSSAKNAAAPYILMILCAYSLITSIYMLVFYDADQMLIRLGLNFLLVLTYIIVERSPLCITVTSFLSPTIISFILIIGAIFLKGDSLLFIYMCCAALISLTYFNTKGLAAHIITVNVILIIILFVFQINLLGENFTFIYNVMSFIASLALTILAYIFCAFSVKMLKSLTDAKKDAELAANAKEVFLANMSHEIRTPLNAIIGLTEAELRRDLPKDDMENLHKIHKSGKLLLGIINDILDKSKIESGTFRLFLSEYTFADMIYDVVNLNIVHIGEKPIIFSVLADENIPRRLIGDELRIKQLLNNFLSNAFKYTRQGNVSLKISCLPEDDGIRLFFTVSDTGIGIRPEDLKNLFDEYTRMDTTANSKISGTGLGLSINKKLAGMMDGSVNVRSEYGKGSVFTVDIRQDIADKTHIGPETANALKNFTYVPEYKDISINYIPMPYASVLVVDDVEINLEVASYCLEPYKIHVDCIDNGAGAVQKVIDGNPRYDIIFMDHMMPGMDGIAATRAIRQIGTEYTKSVPIIALTANAVVGTEKMFLENGFQGFISKPIDPQRLDSVLHQWID